MSSTRKIFLYIGLPLVVIFVVMAIFLLKKDTTGTVQNGTASNSFSKSKDEPAALENIGFDFDTYNTATQQAGAFKFTADLKRILSSDPIYAKQVWRDYGIQDNRSPNDPTKRNVQPTFYLPLGTKVLAPIDGVVTKVETLYSNDSSIWFSKNDKSTWSYETEHVKNVLVKVGDTVTAGQVVAEVSDYTSHNTPGFGLVELGLFHPVDNQPTHWCPFEYLDSSVKEDVLGKISALYAGWEAFMNDTAIYDEASYALPGCETLEPTKG